MRPEIPVRTPETYQSWTFTENSGSHLAITGRVRSLVSVPEPGGSLSSLTPSSDAGSAAVVWVVV